MINQIFRIDSKLWSSEQKDQIDQFFQTNSFLSKFYKHQHFNKLVDITYYKKIPKNSSLILDNQKKPQVIILLCGKINIAKPKQFQNNNLRALHHYHSNIENNIRKNSRRISYMPYGTQHLKKVYYEDFATLSHQHQTLITETDCKITSSTQNQQFSQFLFIPSTLYTQFHQQLTQQLIQNLYNDLKNFFPHIQRKFILNLAKSGCKYKQYKINDIVYKIGDKINDVYLLIDGKIKMDKNNAVYGNNNKQGERKNNIISNETIIIHQNAIFGEKDILFENRIKNAIVVSARVKLLVIEKNQFLRFSRQFLPEIQYQTPLPSNSFHLPVLKPRNTSNNNSLYNIANYNNNKKNISRFHSITQIPSNLSIEQNLIKKCHILTDLSPRGNRPSRFIQKNQTESHDYSKDQFQEKLKLFNRRRPNNKQVNIQNPLFQWKMPTRSNSPTGSVGMTSSGKSGFWKDQIKN